MAALKVWARSGFLAFPQTTIITVRCASKKAGGSSKNLGGNSPGRRYGWKKGDGIYWPSMTMFSHRRGFCSYRKHSGNSASDSLAPRSQYPPRSQSLFPLFPQLNTVGSELPWEASTLTLDPRKSHSIKSNMGMTSPAD
ncbi:uncharacterized protein [Heterodontus francisci]|uniref:uncharacterized protein isoform X2 n=1 Tax=Heterodontus francisci TaxID=7792 RepID=UPI00355B798B